MKHVQDNNVQVRSEEVVIPIDDVPLGGNLAMPETAHGIVLFAHGSGSSRLSPRNRFVAEGLHRAGMGTLLFDLLTEEEAADRANVFDIPMLAERLTHATRWLRARGGNADLPFGYFGASTGAAAALQAAATSTDGIGAIVSRGGRPDLAMDALPRITAPTLLIVGERDDEVLELNRRAYDRLQCDKDLRIVPGATHLFEEAGALELVMEHARDWFSRYLPED